ncbi:hypothetical protein COM83_12090 [Bacillus cereus]|nr:hypothetical protein COM83_12090 [Bacillus cereus]PFJ47017.1 hypothetical protein COI99_25190 [Bacillus cereus]PFK00629.1 hypothetical protein COI97_17565 [Bacillus cereus]PFW18728.1 hypothetical protein COL18_04225 [Bacillus cereus]PGM74810.1 hypothetical protein CN957_26325 [Bacillus cereus]
MGGSLPLIISLHQSGIYGQLISRLTALLQVDIYIGESLLPKNSGVNELLYKKASIKLAFRLNK